MPSSPPLRADDDCRSNDEFKEVSQLLFHIFGSWLRLATFGDRTQLEYKQDALIEGYP
jgi:hypothetical protein